MVVVLRGRCINLFLRLLLLLLLDVVFELSLVLEKVGHAGREVKVKLVQVDGLLRVLLLVLSELFQTSILSGDGGYGRKFLLWVRVAGWTEDGRRDGKRRGGGGRSARSARKDPQKSSYELQTKGLKAEQ